jgi:anthranilate/para-aminobenzoate synthase component II
MMLLFVDNYDSFTYNLVSMMGVLEPSLRVARNDAITVAEALAMDLDGLVLSPRWWRPWPRPCRSWGSAWGTR